MTKEWFPHEFIPYGVGRDYETEPWTPDQPRLGGVARVAFEVNLLTEDNLPSYHRLIHTFFGKGDGAWVNWANRWTAEEGRHAIVLRDYLVVTRNCDPVLLERARMQQVQTGYDHPTADPLRQLAYVAFQELATRISHANTGRFSDDPVADRISERIAADENLHMVFYRDAVAAALELDPSAAVKAVVAEVMDFQMPGGAIQNFARKAAQIARAGIYDLRVHHDEVVWPLLRYWKIFAIGSLDSEAERAREELAGFLSDLNRRASAFEERRAGKDGEAASQVRKDRLRAPAS
jgi:acyl-[acyl-carrier-protein] desaturase